MFIHFLSDIPINNKICIYGMGKRGILFKKYLEKYRNDVEIKCFIDSYKDGESIEGLEVININSLENEDVQYDFIVIASNFWQDIAKILKKRNIFNYKVLGFHFTTCIDDQIPSTIPVNTFEESKIKLYKSYQEKIIDSLETDEDKRLYKKIYDARAGNISLNNLYQEFKDSGKIFYQYLDHINRDEIKTIIDCGVYDGSGIDLLLRFLHNVEKIYGFEPLNDINCPNPENIFSKDQLNKIEIIPKAVFTHKTELSISIGAHGSAITENTKENTKNIETISIDEFVVENKIQKIDFIKIDIENAELPALKGAIRTIENHRPQIATSIYHSNEQFFEVPLFLINNFKNYTHKIGHYSLGFGETVWYSIPNEKFISNR